MTLQARSVRNAQIKIPFKVLQDYLPAKLVTTGQRLEIGPLKIIETDDTPAQGKREIETVQTKYASTKQITHSCDSDCHISCFIFVS